MTLIDLFEAELPQNFYLYKKMQYQWSLLK